MREQSLFEGIDLSALFLNSGHHYCGLETFDADSIK